MKRWYLPAWFLPCLVLALFSNWSVGSHCDSRGRSLAGDGVFTVKGKPRTPDVERARSGGLPRKAEIPVQWRVLAPPAGRRVEIGKFVGWCAGIGQPKPRISRVLESDQGHRVLLTAYLLHRAHGLCGRVAVLAASTVILERPLGRRELYDGSVRPALQRWPRPAR